MQLLSGAGASFVYGETPSSHMHLGPTTNRRTSW